MDSNWKGIEIPIPIIGGRWGALNLPGPMTEATWQHMLAILEAMKPGLVVVPENDSEDEEERRMGNITS